MMRLQYAMRIVCVLIIGGCTCPTHYVHKQSSSNISNNTKHGVICGAAQLNNEVYDTLTVNGAASLNHVTVHQIMHLNGSMRAHDVKVGGPLIINGSAALHNTHVAKVTEVNGALAAFNSTLSDIWASADELSLTESTTGPIILRKQTKPIHTEQRVILDHVTVNGDITFEQGGGRVVSSRGAVIKGTIIGGVYEEQ